ncbi:MAG TPA: TIM barrel protein [Solirubrobacteraceae bacterium]|nr:TIM barrel protein [Solirubrobacteraceae bacterium]
MRWSAHISWLFAELPYAERVGVARAAGFDVIETAWPEHVDERAALIDAVARQRAAARAERRRLDVALLNCPAGDTAQGERGFLNDPARRDEAEDALVAAIELAGAIGARKLNVLVGRALSNTSESRQRAAVLAALRSFAPAAAGSGVQLVLEPINDRDFPGYLAPSADAVVELIEAAGDDSIRLLLDSFHLARAGVDPVAAIARHSQRIAHVQLSDLPARGAPGTGTLDFAAIFDALAASGYDGAVGLEYQPDGPTEAELAAVTRLGEGYLPSLGGG